MVVSKFGISFSNGSMFRCKMLVFGDVEICELVETAIFPIERMRFASFSGNIMVFLLKGIIIIF